MCGAGSGEGLGVLACASCFKEYVTLHHVLSHHVTFAQRVTLFWKANVMRSPHRLCQRRKCHGQKGCFEMLCDVGQAHVLASVAKPCPIKVQRDPQVKHEAVFGSGICYSHLEIYFFNPLFVL